MISIILPVYNEELYIAQFFSSVLNQTFGDWEVVVVDDGSTDNTRQMVREWSDRDSRIRLVHTQGKLGKVNAFNRAFEESRGDTICHIGGDDLAPPNSLERRSHSLAGAPTRSVSFGKFQFMTTHGDPVGPILPRGDLGSQSSAGATYTRDLADLIFPIPVDLPSEDIWLGNAARACSEEVRHIPHLVSYYRQHDTNSNPRRKPFTEMTTSIAQRMSAYRSLLASDLPIPDSYRKQFRQRIETEDLRASGRTLALLRHSDTAFVDRIALASMSRPSLWAIRKRAGHYASGWRGR